MKSRNFFASVVNTTATLLVNTEFTIPHGLMTSEALPVTTVGYIFSRRSGAGSLYPSTTAWDTTNAYFNTENDEKRFFFQSPWYKDGQYAGLVEISFRVPEEIPHFIRE
jgi:hypothetical protein